MTCRAMKKRIPLFVGGELTERKNGRIRRHLAVCPECRTEAGELERTRVAVREMAGAGPSEDWSPTEWRKMIGEITKAREGGRARSVSTFRLRPVLAGALGVLVMAGLIVLQREMRRSPAPETGAFANANPEARFETPPPTSTKDSDVTSVTLVSPETGTKIIWFYNKKFEWQGFGK
jgi:anti-sigma factor RsiW